MENNIGSSGQFKGEQLSRAGSSTGENRKENFREFKHSIMLHERGLEMQEDFNINRSATKVKSLKPKLHSDTVQSIDQLKEDFEDKSEMRLRFKAKHI